MRQRLLLMVPGGNTHIVSLVRLESLQRMAADAGADRFPLFLRISSVRSLTLQPITARGLLAEAEGLAPQLEGLVVPGVRLRGTAGQELGNILTFAESGEIAGRPELRMCATVDGIRLVVKAVPPPVGFRSEPGLATGEYGCYFHSLVLDAKGWQGFRTEAMGGSGAPVALPEVPVPPLARWDLAHVAGTAVVASLEPMTVPAAEVYRDVLHAFISASTESLRLKRPLTIQAE